MNSKGDGSEINMGEASERKQDAEVHGCILLFVGCSGSAAMPAPRTRSQRAVQPLRVHRPHPRWRR